MVKIKLSKTVRLKVLTTGGLLGVTVAVLEMGYVFLNHSIASLANELVVLFGI